ncbi:hypothetical protein [Microcoleus sp. AR_TQ3_B6]|uniref:hypothetical protein n=1 Tax=Microcoleus sp. AR_TQ3_B6 TaxID=3055284 RepID=UPI002FD108AE
MVDKLHQKQQKSGNNTKKISLKISQNLPLISIADLNNSPRCITGLFLPKYFLAALFLGEKPGFFARRARKSRSFSQKLG